MSTVRLYNADCLDVLATLEPGSVDAVVTDPPYSSGGQYRGDRAQTTTTKYVRQTVADPFNVPFSGDNRDQRSFLIWCTLWMGAARRATKPGGVILCFTDWRQLPTVTDAIQCGGWTWRGIATWWKPGIRMTRGRFSSSAEYVVYGSNGPVNEGAMSPQNVFACPPVGGEEKEHQAEKPIDVMRWILGVTPPESTILDPFMGSGTTAIACHQTGRGFIGIEAEPVHYATADRRIEAERTRHPLFAGCE